MKTPLALSTLLAASLCCVALHAQDITIQPRPDRITTTAPVAKKSPMNSASLATPAGYARVVYSQPMLRGREMFGDQVPFGKVWRLGANETTEIFLTRDLEIGGRRLPAGAYGVFAIPEADRWTLIFNRDLGQWGAYNYDPAGDVLRVEAPVSRADESFEAFTVYFEEGALNMAWGTTRVALPIAFAGG